VKLIDQMTARALCDAGYMPVDRYIELCQVRGWIADRRDDPKD
jgi:hypothetical protein